MTGYLYTNEKRLLTTERPAAEQRSFRL